MKKHSTTRTAKLKLTSETLRSLTLTATQLAAAVGGNDRRTGKDQDDASLFGPKSNGK